MSSQRNMLTAYRARVRWRRGVFFGGRILRARLHKAQVAPRLRFRPKSPPSAQKCAAIEKLPDTRIASRGATSPTSLARRHTPHTALGT